MNKKSISEGAIVNKEGNSIGSSTTYVLKDSINENLYRIEDYVSIDHFKYYKTTKTTFYYYYQKVIKATVIIENWKKIIQSIKFIQQHTILRTIKFF